MQLLREARDDPFVAADLIAGFPGESGDDHQRTLRLVEDLGLAALHVFPFSPRPSTEAASLKPAVPERIRRERASELGSLSRRLSADYVHRWAGKEVGVLLQSRAAGRWIGVSENYLRVEIPGLAILAGTRGRIVRARIDQQPEISGGLVRGSYTGPAG